MMIYFLYHLRSNVSSECITIQIERRYLLPQIGVTLFGLIFNTLLANIISRHGWLFWLNSCIMILHYLKFTSSGATALQGFGRQSGRRLSVKLVPTFADRGVSRGQYHLLFLLLRRISDTVITSILNTEMDGVMIVNRTCKL